MAPASDPPVSPVGGRAGPEKTVASLLGDPPPPEVLEKLAELQREKPTAHANTLALDLETAGLGRHTGREVKQWCEWLEATEAA